MESLESKRVFIDHSLNVTIEKVQSKYNELNELTKDKRISNRLISYVGNKRLGTVARYFRDLGKSDNNRVNELRLYLSIISYLLSMNEDGINLLEFYENDILKGSRDRFVKVGDSIFRKLKCNRDQLYAIYFTYPEEFEEKKSVLYIKYRYLISEELKNELQANGLVSFSHSTHKDLYNQAKFYYLKNRLDEILENKLGPDYLLYKSIYQSGRSGLNNLERKRVIFRANKVLTELLNTCVKNRKVVIN